MKIKNIMKKEVVTASLDESVSSILSKMKKNCINQVPILQNGILHGVVELKNIVTKNIDVETTKAESVKINCTILSPDEDVEEGIKKFIQSGLRALPVVDNNNLVGIVSETDFLYVNDILDKNKKVEDVMTECVFVERKDSLGKIKKLMLNENVSRIPVCEKGKLVGTIGTLEIIKASMISRSFDGKAGQSKEKGTKEKLSSESISAESLMRRPFVVSSSLPISKAADLLSKNEELYIEKNGKVYIVTPKDILENIKREQKGVLVDITNIHDEDSYTIEKMHDAAGETVKKLGKFIDGIDSLILRIERMHKLGKKTKYSVRARFFTPMGLFVSHAWGWDLISVTQQCLNKLEHEIKKKRDKEITQKRTEKRRL